MAPPKNAINSRTTLLLSKANMIQDPTAPEHLTAQEHLTFVPPVPASDTNALKDVAEKKEYPPSFQLRHYSAKTLPPPLLQWCFDLVKSTLHHLYLPVWGWSDTDKRKQLEAASSRFVIAFAQQSAPSPAVAASADSAALLAESAPIQPPLGDSGLQASTSRSQCCEDDGGAVPVAMVNYRFEAGYSGEPALYLYEVVVDPEYQRLGLASHLITLMETVAWNSAMDSVVLTEFIDNKAAAALYRRLGYVLDKASPKNKGYELLSKSRPGASKPKSKKK